MLPEADTPKAVALRDDFVQGLHEPIAPDVFPVEVAHALTKAERRGFIPLADSTVKLNDVLTRSSALFLYTLALAGN